MPRVGGRVHAVADGHLHDNLLVLGMRIRSLNGTGLSTHSGYGHRHKAFLTHCSCFLIFFFLNMC